MTRKILCLFMFIVLLGVVSCSKKEVENTPQQFTFTFFSSDLESPQPFDDEIAREITKRTGVTLETIPNQQSSSEAISLMIAEQSFPDFIFAKSDIVKLIEAKAVIPLDDLIEKYGQNMKKLYGNQIVKLKNSLSDPYIYTVGTYEVNSIVNETSGNMQVQNAVLKEFQYPVVKTLDDLENLLIAYKNKYPVINGHNTIGISLLTDSWYWYVGLSNPGNYMIGYPDDGQWIVNQETLEAEYKFLNPEMYKFYKWLNKINGEGLLDPESFSQTVEMWRSKVRSGAVLATTYAHWELSDVKRDLIQNGLTERTYAYLPITAGSEYKDPSLKDYGYSGGWGIAISKDCKNPAEAFKFLDWMCSEEAQVLTNWGIEDVHYYYNSKNKRIPFENIEQNSGIGSWVYPFPQAGTGFIDSTGNPVAKTSRENLISSLNSSDRETLRAYEAEFWTDLFPSAKELGVSKHGQVWQYSIDSKVSELIEKADEYVKSSLIKMIVGPEEDFDNAWNEMQQTLREMGMEEAGKKVSETIAMKMKLWYD